MSSFSSFPSFPSFHHHTWEWSVCHAQVDHMFAGSARVAGSEPACWESQGQCRSAFGLTNSKTWSACRLRWRWGWDCRACILQIRAIHRLYTQDGLFNIPLTLPWLPEVGKCVYTLYICVRMRHAPFYFYFLIGNGSINFSPRFLMWSD